MTTMEHIVVRTEHEREALNHLQDRSFGHHKTFDSLLLIKTGLGHDMDRAFESAGWDEFANTTETGS